MYTLRGIKIKGIITLMFAGILSISSFANTEIDGVDPSKKIFEKWNKEFTAYPSAEIDQKEEGLVEVSFEIEVDGSMKNVAVASSLSETFEDRALEIVESMPKSHLYANGFIEGTRFVVPVKFKID